MKVILHTDKDKLKFNTDWSPDTETMKVEGVVLLATLTSKQKNSKAKLTN